MRLPFRSAFLALLLTASLCVSQQTTNSRQKIILDTDIGGDIDDAFALAFMLASPEFEVLGITTAWGDTRLRARVADRMLCETGMSDIPVMAGVAAEQPGAYINQGRWGEALPKPSKPYGSGVDFILEQIRRYPNEITLLAIAPLSNVGPLVERDPEAFRKLKRVVIMGGSIYRGYGDLGYLPNRGPDPEYNIKSDIPSARRLFASGVPLYVMPLDSTQLKLDEVKREVIFRQITPLTDALTLLYHLWGQQTPTLFDPVAVAFTIRPDICATKPMHIDVDDKGYTRPGAGTPNAQVCLNSKSDEFFELFMSRLLNQKLAGKCKSGN